MTKPRIKPRDITEVMERIRPLLLQGAIDTKDFDRWMTRLAFVAPELRRSPEFWEDLCLWLSGTLPNPTLPDAPQWARDISAIIEGRDG